MKLYIAEKPSLGRAIANALPKPHKNHQGYIELGNGDMVSWCIGHILEQAQPEAYDQAFKKWNFEHLPIIPNQWQLKPKAQTRSQLTVLRKLVKQAKTLVHAGDPDREGQLLVDEVIDFLKVSQNKKRQTKRLLVSDLNVAAVKRSLDNLKDNHQYTALSVSALARSRADWLYGINLTRAYTLQGQKVGFQGVLSVGRVQTPLLGLVVRREQEIEQFRTKPFYQVLAHLNSGKPGAQLTCPFSAKWQASEQCQPYMDDEGRILVKALAENVVNRITNQQAIVNSCKKEEKKQLPPLPYSLSSLQIDAAKQFSMNAKLVLDICQSLYEKHKLITYPRSDCRYLPMEHFKQSPQIVEMLKGSTSTISKAANSANTKLKSKAWNDKKITAHHAIIPTEKNANNIKLNSFEKNIYALVCRNYIAQFYGAYKYKYTTIEVVIAGGAFKTNAKSPIDFGWKVLFQKNKQTTQPSSNSDENGLDNNDEQVLPELQKGDILHCERGELLSKNTQPPKSFTDATLLAAMTGISRFVQDINVKKILKDTDGLGTEATRAGIIDLLFKRGFLYRQGKLIHATDIGKGLVAALPEIATKPDMTAQWEATLNAICDKQASYQSFMEPLSNTLFTIIKNASEHLPTQLKGLKSSGKKPYTNKRKSRKAQN